MGSGVAQSMGVTGYPTTIIVGKDGNVAATHIGFSSGDEKKLAQKIEKLLAAGIEKKPVDAKKTEEKP